MDISLGRVVHYVLTEDNATQINRRRTNGSSIAARMRAEPAEWPAGAQAHIGNDVKAGDVFPLIVTRVWSPGCVNGQVLLDGNDAFWATSRTEGTEPGSWQWPPRV